MIAGTEEALRMFRTVVVDKVEFDPSTFGESYGESYRDTTSGRSGRFYLRRLKYWVDVVVSNHPSSRLVDLAATNYRTTLTVVKSDECHLTRQLIAARRNLSQAFAAYCACTFLSSSDAKNVTRLVSEDLRITSWIVNN